MAAREHEKIRRVIVGTQFCLVLEAAETDVDLGEAGGLSLQRTAEFAIPNKHDEDSVAKRR